MRKVPGVLSDLVQNGKGHKKTGRKVRFYCAQSGNRTRTVLLPQDFESSASTNSAIRAMVGADAGPAIWIGLQIYPKNAELPNFL